MNVLRSRYAFGRKLTRGDLFFLSAQTTEAEREPSAGLFAADQQRAAFAGEALRVCGAR